MGRRKKGRLLNGWINLNKPAGMTSTTALNQVRRMLDARKAGHGGTLDPLATGVLPVALGEATKLIPYLSRAPKTYDFTVRWGEARDTDDAEGAVTTTSGNRPSEDAIRVLLPRYTGVISQLPPKFSALKLAGQRAYDLARDGQEVELTPRNVEVFSLDLVATRQDEADFTVTCGSGTYVRALARDMGADLGCFGHINRLCRTRVGCFRLEDAILLESLGDFGHNPPPSGVLLPLQTVLDDIPALAVTAAEADRLRHGQTVQVPFSRHGETAVTCDGVLVAMASLEGGVLQPTRVFNL